MTVALVLAAEADVVLCGQLAALGVRRIDGTDRTGPGLLTVAAAARAAGERVLIYAGEGRVPEPVLARLLAADGTAAFTGVNALPGESRAGALVADTKDLDALASAAESLAAGNAAPAAVGALLGELASRGVAVRILDAGPDGEGLVAQLLADPAASDMARWAAWRGLTPSALAGISLGLGLLAAIWFSELAVLAKLLAIMALFGSFLVGRAGSLLAASRPGRVSPVADWLGAAAGLLTELAVYAALAVSSAPASHKDGLTGVFGGTLRDTAVAGWGGTGQVGVWRLAVAATGVLAVRRMAALCYGYPARTPGNLSRRPVLRALEQSVTLPVGERFLVIAVTSVFFGPRLTFAVLLCWGVLGTAYLLAAQIAGSAGPAGAAGPAGDLAAYRGDGVVSRWLGGLVQGRLPPLLAVPVSLLVTGVLVTLGLANLPGILVLTPVEAMLLSAMGSRHPHDGRLDWLTPPLLQAGEYVFLAALGFAYRVPAPVVFALMAAVVARHADLAHRARVGRPIPADVHGLGWDGRMLLAGLAAVIGIVPFAYAALSGYLWLLFFWDFLSGWLSARDGDGG
jgi:hypothetical protein